MTTKLTTQIITSVGREDNLVKLVTGAQAGCEISWREIVDRFHDHLQHVATAHGLDRSAAADAVQQTWLAAVANINALRNAQALGGWLRSILHRECLKTRRLRQREASRLDNTGLTGYAQTVTMHTEPLSPEEEALRVEQQMLVQMARRRLSRRDQELLTLLIGLPSFMAGTSEERFGCLSCEDCRETASLGVLAGGLSSGRMSSR